MQSEGDPAVFSPFFPSGSAGGGGGGGNEGRTSQSSWTFLGEDDEAAKSMSCSKKHKRSQL